MKEDGKKPYKMKMLLLFFVTCLPVYSQDMKLVVPNRHFAAACGTGIDTRIYLQRTGANPVTLSVTTLPGIEAVVQPDTLFEADTVILSMLVTDGTVPGEHYPVYIISTDQTRLQVDTLDLEVIGGNPAYTDHKLAEKYRDSALHFIMREYPAVRNEYGDLLSFGWTGFYPYPPPDIVSHFVFLYGNWRINVLWHVMVPPYDWKKVFVYNTVESTGWGIQMDSENQAAEILPEKHYYFYQDTAVMTGIREMPDRNLPPVVCPNPFTTQTVISFRNADREPFTFRLFDMNGRLIRQVKGIRDSRFILHREGLKSGVYYFHLTGSTMLKGIIVAT